MEQIPKIIHYCWFGGNDKPELIKRCIDSWKNYFPDWEITEWNEANYDVRKIPYIAEAYEAKKWAFVSDYARFDVLYQYGGIYLDTDVEFLKPLPEEYLCLEAFTGFEHSAFVAPGLLFGARKKADILEELLNLYKTEHFAVQPTGGYKTVNHYMDDVLLEGGLIHNNKQQTIKGLTIFPSEYFCGYDTDIHELDITEKTICCHHYYGSWSETSLKRKLQDVLKKLVGKKVYKKMVLAKRKLVKKV